MNVFLSKHLLVGTRKLDATLMSILFERFILSCFVQLHEAKNCVLLLFLLETSCLEFLYTCEPKGTWNLFANMSH